MSFENSGRTLLLCRPYSPAEQARANDTGSATATGEDALARGLIEALGDRRGAAQSCRAYRNRRDDPWDARFAVRFDASPSTSIYTGRRFANDTDARADIQRTRMVREQLGHGKLHFAEPVARLAEQPRLVVYDFDPWLNLTEYLDDRGDVAVVQRATQRVGLVLSMLHGSSLHLETSSWEDYREGIALAASEWSKEAAGDVTRDSARWRAVWETCQRGLEATDNVPAVPGHGALRWAHIHYGVDGRFYLSHWERCARRHPGIDTASFVADLLTYTYQRNDARLFEVGLDSFARAYCGDAPTAAWWNQLPALVAGEIVARHADELFIGESSLELVERACAMQLP